MYLLQRRKESHEKWNVAQFNTNNTNNNSKNKKKRKKNNSVSISSIANKLLPHWLNWLTCCVPASLPHATCLLPPATCHMPPSLACCQLSSSGRQCSISSKVFNFQSIHTVALANNGPTWNVCQGEGCSPPLPPNTLQAPHPIQKKRKVNQTHTKQCNHSFCWFP